MDTKVLHRTNGSRFHYSTETEAVKEMFLRQWSNGDLETYMKNVKDRIKQMYKINLSFKNEHEFFDELVKCKLIEIIKK